MNLSKIKSLSLLVVLGVSLFSCRNIGTPATEETLPDYIGVNLQGDTVSLHSFYGNNKILLVNFWAGWCGDCREHNPELVALYDKYKDFEIAGNTFDIVSISLDKKETQWKQVIAQQNLYWPNHIADMSGYDSEQIKEMGVTWIPTNFLLDENGVILAKDVDRTSFESILRKHYKN